MPELELGSARPTVRVQPGGRERGIRRRVRDRVEPDRVVFLPVAVRVPEGRERLDVRRVSRPTRPAGLDGRGRYRRRAYPGEPPLPALAFGGRAAPSRSTATTSGCA